MREIMELGIWDIWERPLFFTFFKTTEEYYLLKSGETARKKAIKKEFSFLLVHANTYLYSNTHTSVQAEYYACISLPVSSLRKRAPSRGSDVHVCLTQSYCILEVLILQLALCTSAVNTANLPFQW